MSHWFRNVGIDLGLKSAHEVGVIDPDGKTFRLKVWYGSQDLDGMLQRLNRGLPPGGKLRFVMEPTDTAWVSVAWWLTKRGYEVFLVPALMVHDFREALSKYAKTDRLDASTLASLFTIPMASQSLNKVVWGSRDLETLKRLVKRDFHLATGISDRKKRIEALVRLGLPTGVTELDIFSLVGRYLCSHFLSPSTVAAMSAEALAVAVAPLASFEAHKVAQIWHDACKEALSLYGENGPAEYEVLEWECRTELRWLGYEEEELSYVRDEIATLMERIDPDGILESAPGVGPVAAAAVTAALGDITRFVSARQFRAYTGLVPKVSRSGVSNSKGQKITKAGPNWLKRSLFLAADWTRRLDPQLAKVYYDQMVKYGHHHTHAVCAVATRLADRLFICCREHRRYELRDLDGNPISSAQARAFIADHLTVPEEVRKRLRRGTRPKKRKTPTSNVRASS